MKFKAGDKVYYQSDEDNPECGTVIKCLGYNSFTDKVEYEIYFPVGQYHERVVEDFLYFQYNPSDILKKIL